MKTVPIPQTLELATMTTIKPIKKKKGVKEPSLPTVLLSIASRYDLGSQCLAVTVNNSVSFSFSIPDTDRLIFSSTPLSTAFSNNAIAYSYGIKLPASGACKAATQLGLR
jgi:hypothetical protein